MHQVKSRDVKSGSGFVPVSRSLASPYFPSQLAAPRDLVSKPFQERLVLTNHRVLSSVSVSQSVTRGQSRKTTYQQLICLPPWKKWMWSYFIGRSPLKSICTPVRESGSHLGPALGSPQRLERMVNHLQIIRREGIRSSGSWPFSDTFPYHVFTRTGDKTGA